MSERRERGSQGLPTMIGGSSLLVIFAVLCLTVFALLGLSTVLADKRLADASARAVAAYYQADARAEEVFARLRNGEEPEGGTATAADGRGMIYSYTFPISETQELLVELLRTEDGWKVLRWQAVARQQAEETQLEVWDGKTTS